MDSYKKQELKDNYTLLTSSEHEARIIKAHVQKQPITLFRMPLDVTALNIPKLRRRTTWQLELTDTKNSVKAPLYRAVVAAYNYAFFNEAASASAKSLIGESIPEFVNWINTKKVGNKYKLLKEYETDWFDKRGNHGSVSPLVKLKTALFNYAYEESEFTQQLTANDANFLMTLFSTKKSARTHKKHDSLASYFGAMPWLRDENIGLGADLYRVLASPKLTIRSLKALVSTIILAFYEAKVALRDFLLLNHLLVENLNNAISQLVKVELTPLERKVIISNAIYPLFTAFHDLSSPPDKLKNAMQLLAISSLTTLGMNYHQELTKSKASLYEMFKYKNKEKEKNGGLSLNQIQNYFSLSLNGYSPMFSIRELILLSNPEAPLPITEIERLMFSWMMASLTVQPEDIKKLNKNDFRLLKVGQRVTDIECEYFKGRSNATHSTRSLSVRKDEGKALLIYLNQHSGIELQAFESNPPAILSGGRSVIGNLTSIISLNFINTALQKAHYDAPIVVPKAIQSLVNFGQLTIPKQLAVSYRNRCPDGSEIYSVNTSQQKEDSKSKLLRERTFSQLHIFGFRTIKNSAVHAYSDPYSLQYLINHNSHSNQTEKTNYLNQDNEEWINASGRITRSVLFDLINNVFDLDFSSATDEKKLKQEVAKFNFEFENVCQSISYKSEEMLARLQIVTEQPRGRINEVGVLSYSVESKMQFAPIYVLDSPVTVSKMLNYLFEFKRNYKKLLNQNADHFYQTVLPTVEWAERVLSTKLSSESIARGHEMFERMQRSGVSMQVFHSI